MPQSRPKLNESGRAALSTALNNAAARNGRRGFTACPPPTPGFGAPKNTAGGDKSLTKGQFLTTFAPDCRTLWKCRAMIRVFLVTLALAAASYPSKAISQTYESTYDFCRISQMLIPIFLRGGDISGKSVCDVGGGASYRCNSSMGLGEAICIAGGGASYQCNSSMSLGAGVCVAGGGASYQCNNSMDLGEAICIAGGGASYQCNSAMNYAHGVCIAGGGASYQCNSSISLGEAVCIAGGGGLYECSGIGDQDLGEGICLALGGSKLGCAGTSVSDAVCSFTGNCNGDDAASIAISMVETCGPAVLHYGIEQ